MGTAVYACINDEQDFCVCDGFVRERYTILIDQMQTINH